MINALEGVQFRERKAEFPSYGDDDILYGEWEYVAETDGVLFPSYTQFRLKPVIAYEVTGSTLENPRFTDLSEAMAKVSHNVEAYGVATIRAIPQKMDLITYLNSRTVQIRRAGYDDSWKSIIYITPTEITEPTYFRIRPDHHFRVVTDSAVIKFDDADNLAKYVDKQIRTGSYDFKVEAIKYAV